MHYDKLPLKRINEGVAIFKQFELGRQAYIIKSGKVEIFHIKAQDLNEREISIGVLETGAMFGEMALIDDKPRMASARAVGGDVVLKVITKDQFKSALENVSPFVSKLIHILSHELRSSSTKR